MPDIKIAIDGPSGSGKSTTARLAAQKLGYKYIDTGAMYRAVTYCWMKSGKEFDEEKIGQLIDNCNFEFKFNSDTPLVFLNGKDISKEIRTQAVTRNVSKISALNTVRENMVVLQRKAAEGGGAILDGRDIGTVVFPDAELKVYLVASIDSRAERRYNEIVSQGEEADLKEIKKDLMERDLFDSSRQISPLTKAKDAIEIDTSNLTIDEQTEFVVNLAKNVMRNKER